MLYSTVGKYIRCKVCNRRCTLDKAILSDHPQGVRFDVYCDHCGAGHQVLEKPGRHRVIDYYDDMVRPGVPWRKAMLQVLHRRRILTNKRPYFVGQDQIINELINLSMIVDAMGPTTTSR